MVSKAKSKTGRALRCPLLVVLSMFLSASCYKFDPGPRNAQVSCSEDNARCPDGFICRNNRCLPLDVQDETAPAVKNLQPIDPAVGKADYTFRLVFDVSEELAADPVVTATCRWEGQC